VRLIAVWLVCFGAYAATLGTDAVPGTEYAGHEPHYLLAAASIVDDGDLDVTNQYAQSGLRPDARPFRGRLHGPEGVGLALLVAPAYALGGSKAVELWLAALTALGFVLGALLGRKLVPEPWASTGALLVGLSPPALGYAATVAPELTAGALLAGAALCALSLRERARAAATLGGAALLAALPWLGPEFLLPALPVAIMLVSWTLRARRRVLALLAGEVILASLVFYASLNDALYGGLTPYATALHDSPTGAEFPLGYVERVPRLVALWLDRDVGLLRWAPILALAFYAAWLLWRSRREHLARAVPARAEAEVAAGLLLAVCAGALVVAAFAAPALRGPWFPGRHLVCALPCAAALVGWGLRHAPRAGAVLGVLTLLASAWLFIQVRGGDDGWSPPASRAPLGPLADALPRWDSAWAAVVAAAVAAALAAVVAREWRDRAA
jgi:hypothetical protein